MNPTFPVQRPPTATNHVPHNDLHQTTSIGNQQSTSQWAALNTDPQLQRTLCQAAASGQLTQEQMSSFSLYMKGNPTAFKMYQLELQAQQQQHLHQNQQQQQQQQQSTHQTHQTQHLEPANGNNAFMQSSHPNPQVPLQLQQQPINHHYSSPQQSNPVVQPNLQQSRMPDSVHMLSGDVQLTQTIAQFRQTQDLLKNPNLTSAERENAAIRGLELREALATRMTQLGIRRDPNVGSPAPTPLMPGSQGFQQAGQTGQPQHPNDVQRAHLSVAYQRQQQMMSGMPIPSQPPGGNNIARPLSRNLAPTSASSPRPLNLMSGRNSPSPNPTNANSNNIMQSISRPNSSQQSMMGPASSPPALHNATSPPNNTASDLARRVIAARPVTGKNVGTPPNNIGSPLNANTAPSPRPPSAASINPLHMAQQPQSNNLNGNLAPHMSPAAGRVTSPPVAQTRETSLPAPPSQNVTASEPITRVTPPTQGFPSSTQIPKPAVNPTTSTQQSQQYSAIAAQQQASSQPVTSTTTIPPTTHNAPVVPREVPTPRPTSPVPSPFPAPRPTLTGGHATSTTLSGTTLHRPPVNGIHEALGQSNNHHDPNGRGGQESASSSRILSKRKIQELVESIDPSERLEAEVEDLLLELADEFIDSVTRFSCQLAKHRKSDRLETKDIQLHLERSWNIRIPGFANDEIRQSQSRRVNALPSYQARVAAVREAAKKRRPTT